MYTMLYSMTGFGKSEGTFEDKKIQIQIKTLNSKQTDVYTKIPQAYKSFDVKMRAQLAKLLHRGKIELSIQTESLSGDTNTIINHTALNNYLKQLEEYDTPDALSIVMKLPEVLISNKTEVGEEEWNFLSDLINTAAAELEEYRRIEGERTGVELKGYINSIVQLLAEVEPFEKPRTGKIKERMQAHLEERLLKENIDADRFEQEMIFYIEKLDITEEKVRLSSNCKYFFEVMESDSPTKGKKLGFVCQEIGREINTLGSKANNSDMQKLVIRMKDELEKVKEQVLNIL